MAKIYGINGALTGKLGNSVMAIRNGVQVARQYQPVVANPSTDAQVAARARLKLMSQLSAVMAPVIAMPKQGIVSTRNIFVKENYGKSTYSDNDAKIMLTSVSLTKSVVSLPNVIAMRTENVISAVLEAAMNLDVNRVVYALFLKMTDGTLRYMGSRVATTAGTDAGWGVTFNVQSVDTNFVVYAYGVRDNTEAARAYFGNLQAPTAENVAKLVTQRVMSETDITLTETKAVELNPGA